MKQPSEIYGLSLSPITANRPNSPAKPGLFGSIYAGNLGLKYVAVQTDRSTTVNNDWKLNRAVIDAGRKNSFRT
jgi:hypothetical protein